MKLRKTLLWTAVGLVVSAGIVLLLWHTYCGVKYAGEETRVYVPAGATEEAVGDSLRTALGAFGDKVYRLWKLQGGRPDVGHGSYLVQPGDKAVKVARNVVTGRETPLRVTFNNLRTFGELSRLLAIKLEADSAAFGTCADTLFAAQGYARAEFAAAVLPDTYEYYWTASPERVFLVMTQARERFWDTARVAKARTLGLNPVEVATIASIVEEETAKPDERPIVARLYLNRLKKGMSLQADPTVKFAIGDFSLRRITAAHLVVESPYNTYAHPGLPPGPIRIVERASIDAVLNAPEHSYLYMCAKPDFSGYHDFAETYERHRINAARYHRALNQRGIE